MFTFKYIRYSVSNVSWYSDLSRLRASLRIQTIPILWHDRHNHEFNLLFCILGRWRTDLGQSNLRKTTSAFRQYSPFWFWCCCFIVCLIFTTNFRFMNIVHYVAVRIELYDIRLWTRETNRRTRRWMVQKYPSMNSTFFVNEWNGKSILGHMLQTNQLND